MRRVFVIGAMLSVCLTSVATGYEANDAAPIPTLRPYAAAFYMRKALGRRPVFSFANSYARRVSCGIRLSQIRRRCTMSWIIGDTGFIGHGTIWVTFQRGGPYWNYSYRVVRVNEYCAAVTPDADCTRVFVAR